MADLRDFLARFRPAGAPGAARAGVPADRSAELEAELGPVLALLAGTDAECGRLIEQARRDAARVTDQARAEAAGRAIGRRGGPTARSPGNNGPSGRRPRPLTLNQGEHVPASGKGKRQWKPRRPVSPA